MKFKKNNPFHIFASVVAVCCISIVSFIIYAFTSKNVDAASTLHRNVGKYAKNYDDIKTKFNKLPTSTEKNSDRYKNAFAQLDELFTSEMSIQTFNNGVEIYKQWSATKINDLEMWFSIIRECKKNKQDLPKTDPLWVYEKDWLTITFVSDTFFVSSNLSIIAANSKLIAGYLLIPVIFIVLFSLLIFINTAKNESIFTIISDLCDGI